jgi:hypothetical protein
MATSQQTGINDQLLDEVFRDARFKHGLIFFRRGERPQPSFTFKAPNLNLAYPADQRRAKIVPMEISQLRLLQKSPF